MKDENIYLEHILECIQIIEQYTVVGRESLNEPKTLDAVIRRMQVMAESCLRLSDDRRNSYPAVGWQHIRNFRNRLVHEYLEVDKEAIWTIIAHDLTPLRSAVEDMLRNPPK